MRVYRDDQKFINFRINVLLWANVTIFVLLAGSFWFVQGLHADKYRTLSEANAMREIIVPAKRGLIMDRNGKVLADNQPSYALSVDRALLKALTKADPNHKAKLFAFIGSVLGVPVGEVQARYDIGVSTAIGMAQRKRARRQSTALRAECRSRAFEGAHESRSESQGEALRVHRKRARRSRRRSAGAIRHRRVDRDRDGATETCSPTINRPTR